MLNKSVIVFKIFSLLLVILVSIIFYLSTNNNHNKLKKYFVQNIQLPNLAFFTQNRSIRVLSLNPTYNLSKATFAYNHKGILEIEK